MGVKKDYRTSDLYFAAYLRAMGIEFLGTSIVGRRMYFIFPPEEDWREVKDGYFSGKAEVPALQHANEIRTLKRLCHM